MARKQGKKKRKGNKVYAIVVDGATEVWYFQKLAHHEREQTKKIQVKPELPKSSSLSYQFETTQRLLEEGYDLVIWLIDFDTVLKEQKEWNKKGQSPIKQLEDYIQKMDKQELAKIYFNVPCLEFWFLLHFEETGKFYKECDATIQALKKHLKDYNKTRKYFNKKDNDIYLKLRPHLPDALKNAAKLGWFDLEDYQKAKCEVYRIFEDLGIIL